jgi:hypothetical protein
MLTVLTPAPSYDLTTLETVKLEMAITSGADDTFIGGLIRQASADVASYCGRVLALETVREVFRSPCSGIVWRGRNVAGSLWLSRWPVASVVSVTECGTVLDDGTDYELDGSSGELVRVFGGWIGWGGPVIVEYSGGYDLLPGLPHDIERATIDLIKRRYYARSRDPALRSQEVLDLVNKSFTAEGSEPMKRGLPRSIAERLDRYASVHA